MNSFLKAVLIVMVVILASRLLPLALGLGVLVGATTLVLSVLGISTIAVAAGVVLALAAALSPIWVPIALLIGVVMLCKRSDRAHAE